MQGNKWGRDQSFYKKRFVSESWGFCIVQLLCPHSNQTLTSLFSLSESHTSRGNDAEGSVRVHRNGRLRCHSASWQTHQIRIEEKRFPSLSECVFKLRFTSTTPPRSLPLSSAYFTISTKHKTIRTTNHSQQSKRTEGFGILCFITSVWEITKRPKWRESGAHARARGCCSCQLLVQCASGRAAGSTSTCHLYLPWSEKKKIPIMRFIMWPSKNTFFLLALTHREQIKLNKMSRQQKCHLGKEEQTLDERSRN